MALSLVHPNVAVSEHPVPVQSDITLTFTQEAAGISWPEYMELYCAGAKQLFFHEKSKLGLQLNPAVMSNL